MTGFMDCPHFRHLILSERPTCGILAAWPQAGHLKFIVLLLTHAAIIVGLGASQYARAILAGAEPFEGFEIERLENAPSFQIANQHAAKAFAKIEVQAAVTVAAVSIPVSDALNDLETMRAAVTGMKLTGHRIASIASLTC
jgi:hypothetical protein